MSEYANDLWLFESQIGLNVTSVVHSTAAVFEAQFSDTEKDEKNISSNVGEMSDSNVYNVIITVVISSLLGILILLTIVGNLFVIIAILSERNLRTVGNYLLLSLGIADLMVACLVMPLGAVYAVSSEWQMGEIACDIWTSTDVLCCTASILHLLAIAIDRYWAVTSIDYIRNRNSNRIGLLIFIIWTVSALISIAPILGLKDANFKKRIEEEKRCYYSQDVTYQVIATVSTFYGPLIFILILYWRIYQVYIMSPPCLSRSVAACKTFPASNRVALRQIFFQFISTLFILLFPLKFTLFTHRINFDNKIVYTKNNKILNQFS
ncbi:5-hydroxytryptamine receptor 2A-like protein [Leptotrombidium deliense]|uniref:5-hydroxytryptamine receptor 2A-like protein n=1 Tax=Leptotrombidium deliense TaxID=299467 RepID=A0A443SD45_9ACAR|nr:5-hydroxytryptamine receptor 2A-like protein [Leptotrombidium deliense]